MKKLLLLLVMIVLPLVASTQSVSSTAVKINGLWFDMFDQYGQGTCRFTAEFGGQGGASYSLYTGDIIIPPTVNNNGTTYSVTTLGANVLWNSSGVTSIYIPNTITAIEDLNGSQTIKGVMCNIDDPNTIKDNQISGKIISTNNSNLYKLGSYSDDCILVVPATKKNAYIANGWDTVFKGGIYEGIVIIADNKSMTYGNNVPQFTWTFFKVKDDPIYGEPEFTCSANSHSNVGTYPIVVTSKNLQTNDITNFKHGVLTINRAPLTITANSYTISQGDPLPTFEATYSGFKNDETSSVLTKQPSFSCSATSASAPGTYDIIVSGATATNYSFTYVKGTLTISPKSASSLTINSISAVTYTGLAQTPAITVKDGTKTLTQGTDYTVEYSNNINAGTATVTVTGMGNYTGTKTANFTINKALLTITAKSYTINQGESLPTFEAEYSGFVNNETSSVLTTQPTFSCSATSTSAPGTYDIIVSGAAADNYEISYVKGTLQIIGNGSITPYKSLDDYIAESTTTQSGTDVEISPIIENISKIYIDLTKYTTKSSYCYLQIMDDENSNIIYISSYNLQTTHVGNIRYDEGDFTGINYAEHWVGTYWYNLKVLAGSDVCDWVYYNDNNSNEVIVDVEKCYDYASLGQIKGWQSNFATSCITKIETKSSTERNISFADANVKALCVANWDTNGDGELSEAEAAVVSDLGEVFKENNKIVTFDELQYFSGLLSISNSAFFKCIGLTSVTIPNSVTKIEYQAFMGTGLTSIMIPESITEIENNVFVNCNKMSSMIVELGNTIFDSRDNCNAIVRTSTNQLIAGCKSTVIPNTVTSIGDAAFWGHSGLTSITIPNNVSSIGERGFSACSGLTSIAIPDGITSINKWTFEYCNNLVSVTIPSSVTSIGGWAFHGCKKLTSIEIPNNVKTIDKYAFSRCESLTSITIPNSVTSISSSVFSYCPNLTTIEVESGNSVYDSRDNCNAIIKTSSNMLVAGCMNTTIPNSVTAIYQEAFYGCTSLTSIVIPNSVTEIGNSVFQNCSSLASTTISNGVTVIGKWAFQYCTSLASITIPNSVTTIGSQAFDGCSGLTSVEVEWDIPLAIVSSVFENSNYQNATLYVPHGTKTTYEDANVWKEFNEIVEMVSMKCATPTITVVDGKVCFDSKTPGVTFKWSYSFDSGNAENEGNEAILAGTTTCHISVYATKDGYENSDISTADVELFVGKKGDINADGVVSITDAVSVVNIILDNSEATAAPAMKAQ